MVTHLSAVLVAILTLAGQRIRIFGVRTFLFTVRPIFDVFAGVTMIRALIGAGVGALFVAVFACAVTSFISARYILARSEASGSEFEVATG
jgi:hypothetical protein